MATLQEQLQRKRVPIDTWDIKEKLLLASAVVRSGDQNWMSVSRLMKSIGHVSRPADWYSQKNCAAQYGLLLEHVETPKRKKRTAASTTESVMETPSESILRRLKDERIQEIQKLMIEEKRTYLKIKDEIKKVSSGVANEAQLREMCLQIDQENKQKEVEAANHAEWLKQREEKKLELERQWRPMAKLIPSGQKRKISENIDAIDPPKLEPISNDEIAGSGNENKSGTSPLLTSLLKLPSPATPSAAASSILHSAITNTAANQRGTSPTIASLLNSSPDVTVSPGLQQLVSTAIGQEPAPTSTPTHTSSTGLESSLISNPSNTHHSQLIITPDEITSTVKVPPVITDNIEEEIQLIEEVLKDVEENESKVLLERKDDVRNECNSEIGEIKIELDKGIVKSMSDNTGKLDGERMTPLTGGVLRTDMNRVSVKEDNPPAPEKPGDKTQSVTDIVMNTPSIREVSVVLEDLENAQQGNIEIKKDSDLQHELESDKKEGILEDINVEDQDDNTNDSSITDDSLPSGSIDQATKDEHKEELTNVDNSNNSDEQDMEIELKMDDSGEHKHDLDADDKTMNTKIDIELSEGTQKSTLTDESDFDDVSISMIKAEKIKRDYSRTKKKEEKEIDFLLADEKDDNTIDSLESLDLEEDEIVKKIEIKHKVKLDADRSVSPWTEEEAEVLALARTRRRYSTTATPSDSVPNSPASSVAGFEDDRDYRAWKKSVMLVYNRLATHKFASLFMRPITDDQAPGYHGIIREPKDLQTLRRNIDNGTIKTTRDFIRYVLVMFQNAIMYNKTYSYVFTMAREMQADCIQQIRILVQAQTQIETPARRETRTSEPKHKAGGNSASATTTATGADLSSSVGKSRKRKLLD